MNINFVNCISLSCFCSILLCADAYSFVQSKMLSSDLFRRDIVMQNSPQKVCNDHDAKDFPSCQVPSLLGSMKELFGEGLESWCLYYYGKTSCVHCRLLVSAVTYLITVYVLTLNVLYISLLKPAKRSIVCIMS